MKTYEATYTNFTGNTHRERIHATSESEALKKAFAIEKSRVGISMNQKVKIDIKLMPTPEVNQNVSETRLQK